MRKEMLWAMLLVSLMALSMVNAIKATPDSTIYIEPGYIIDKTLTPGSTIQVGIGIDYGDLIWGYQIDLTFNPNVLHVVSYDDAGFLGSLGGTLQWIPGQGIDNVNGKLELFGAALFEKDPALTPSGGGILAIIIFEVVGSGASSIDTGSDTGVLNIYGFWIAHAQPLSGLFVNYAPPMYARLRGAITYEAWQTGLVGTEQTLYSRLENYGETSTMVRVTFRVKGPAGIDTYLSDEAVIPALAEGIPGSAVVSASFVPGPPGKYYYSAILEFKEEGMTQYWPWELFVSQFGGDAASKDVNIGFIVKTHM